MAGITYSNFYIYLEKLCPYTTELDLSGFGLTDLPCILKFQRLRVLHIEDNRLTRLPPFPSSLKKIYCSHNNLLALPNFPECLQFIDCSNNPELSQLPVHSPDVQVICDNTSINLTTNNGMSDRLYSLIHTHKYSV